jgi:hypothetical protein
MIGMDKCNAYVQMSNKAKLCHNGRLDIPERQGWLARLVAMQVNDVPVDQPTIP